MFYRTSASIGQRKFTRFKEYWPKLILEGGIIIIIIFCRFTTTFG